MNVCLIGGFQDMKLSLYVSKEINKMTWVSGSYTPVLLRIS